MQPAFFLLLTSIAASVFCQNYMDDEFAQKQAFNKWLDDEHVSIDDFVTLLRLQAGQTEKQMTFHVWEGKLIFRSLC